MPDRLPISARIDGRDHPRAAVLAWEHGRARKVARRLRVPVDAPDLLRRLTDRKLELGHDALRRIVRRDLLVSTAGSALGARASAGRRTVATTVLTCPDGQAAHVPTWYHAHFNDNDERPLLAASPDHWISRHHPDGGQEVLETTGGSPVVTRMFFDDHDLASVRSPADPDYPVEWLAVARTAGGTPIGGIRHRFRDEPSGGFTVELNVEFPLTVPPFMVHQHCWHLAGEFSNWIELAGTHNVAP